MLKYKKNPTLSQGGLDIGLKVGKLAEIGYMLQECAVWKKSTLFIFFLKASLSPFAQNFAKEPKIFLAQKFLRLNSFIFSLYFILILSSTDNRPM